MKKLFITFLILIGLVSPGYAVNLDDNPEDGYVDVEDGGTGNNIGVATDIREIISTNSNKTGITTAQSDAIVANTAKTGITTAQAAEIATNTLKTGITTEQASAITTNASNIALKQNRVTGSCVGQVVVAINADGTVTCEDDDEAAAGTGEENVNADWESESGDSQILNKPTVITTAQADAIVANTAKTGITTEQAAAIVANTAKISFDSTSSTKLAGIDTGAKDDQTGAEIKALYEAESDTNAYTDAEKTKVTNTPADTTTTLATMQAEIDALGTGGSFDESDDFVLTGEWDFSDADVIFPLLTADPYDSNWNGLLEFASKDDVYDEIEDLRANPIYDIIAKTSTGTISTAECQGKIITNTGATGDIVLTFSDITEGDSCIIILTAAYDIDINPYGTEQLLVVTDSAGDAISSDATVGSMISFVAVSDTQLMPVGKTGTWTDVD